MNKLVIIGIGGLTKQAIEEVFDYVEWNQSRVLFLDELNSNINLFNGRKVFHSIDSLECNFILDKFVILFSNGNLRNDFFERASISLLNYPNLISKYAHTPRFSSNIGHGNIILKGAVLENYTSIGNFNLLNIGSKVTHDCKLGDYIDIGPGAIICGGAIIGNNCSIGAGSVILPKVKIGNNVIIGAGTIVNKDIPANELWVGNPANRVR